MAVTKMAIALRIVVALAIVLFGPLLGILIAVALSTLALPSPPAGGLAAPGDGFLGIGYALVGLYVSVPVSLVFAGIVLFAGTRRKP